MSKKKDTQPPPMSLRLPEDLSAELTAVAEQLGESEATVARMSMRHGLKVLLGSFKEKRPEKAAA